MKKVRYNKILLTHDGSKLASIVLPHVITIANSFKSEVIILQVIDSRMQIVARTLPSPPYATGFENAKVAEEIAKSEMVAAGHNLKKLQKELETAGVPKVTGKILEGIAGDQIVKFAKNHRIHLIAMSTHGRSGLSQVLMGSVADYVLRHVSCPVLLFHPKRR